eukprot:g29276.t1
MSLGKEICFPYLIWPTCDSRPRAMWLALIYVLIYSVQGQLILPVTSTSHEWINKNKLMCSDTRASTGGESCSDRCRQEVPCREPCSSMWAVSPRSVLGRASKQHVGCKPQVSAGENPAAAGEKAAVDHCVRSMSWGLVVRAGTGSPKAVRAGTGSPKAVRGGTGSPEMVRRGTGSPEAVRGGTGSPEAVRVGTDSPEAVKGGTGSPEAVREGTDSPEA